MLLHYAIGEKVIMRSEFHAPHGSKFAKEIEEFFGRNIVTIAPHYYLLQRGRR